MPQKRVGGGCDVTAHNRKDTMPTHPKCGKTFPGGSTAGHCSGCCETFIGMSAFEAHRRGDHGTDRHCEITDKHWTDDRGYYHVGPKLTEEQKAKMWPKDEE